MLSANNISEGRPTIEKIIFLMASLLIGFVAFTQNVGIGTTNPLAILHEVNSNVIFSTSGDIPVQQEMS